MTWELFCKAIFAGILNVAPVGPVGILCLQSQLCEDRRGAFSAALGMACGYLVVSLCVLQGLKTILHFLEEHRVGLQVVLGALLVAIGGHSLLRDAKDGRLEKKDSKRIGGFLGTFVMTLFNPVPFASFAVILTFLQVASSHFDVMTDVWFSVSVFTGTIVFWWCLRLFLESLPRSRWSMILQERIFTLTGGRPLLFRYCCFHYRLFKDRLKPASKGLFQHLPDHARGREIPFVDQIP